MSPAAARLRAVTSLAALTRRIAPPAEAVDGRGDWEAVESALGTALPEDFKSLVESYGSGDFCSFVFLHTPFGDGELVSIALGLRDGHHDYRSGQPENYPYPLHPEPGGLLPWGGTTSGDLLCWLTHGPPHTWPVVVWDANRTYEVHDMPASEFLDRWSSGRIDSALLPTDSAAVRPWFDAWREMTHVYVRLDGGPLPYDERLQILRDALAPTADRGSVVTSGSRRRQDRFIATPARWQLTYETAYGHQIRAAFPPGDNDLARQEIFRAVQQMGCNVVWAREIDGTPTWAPLPQAPASA